jgi:hypothetical protein
MRRIPCLHSCRWDGIQGHNGICLYPPVLCSDPSKPQTCGVWAWHVLPTGFTGAANKDLANEYCDVGFIAYYCFGQHPDYSLHNLEEHIEGNVLEYLNVFAQSWQPGSSPSWGQYMSCCPPNSTTNPSSYYRCNTCGSTSLK